MHSSLRVRDADLKSERLNLFLGFADLLAISKETLHSNATEKFIYWVNKQAVFVAQRNIWAAWKCLPLLGYDKQIAFTEKKNPSQQILY